MFSMFFIVSEETAHNIVTYLAAGIAIAIIIMGLSIALIQKRKIAQTKEANTEKNFVQTPSIHDQKITKYLESSSAEKENQSVKQEPIIQLTKQSRTQISAQLNTDRISITNREEAMSEGKRICEICKEKFRAPLYQIDYSSSQLELIRICPYCRQSLDSQPENTRRLVGSDRQFPRLSPRQMKIYGTNTRQDLPLFHIKCGCFRKDLRSATPHNHDYQ